MAELDSLIDSLLPQGGGQEIQYIDAKYATTIQLRHTGVKGQGVFAERFISDREQICSLGYPTMMAIDSDFIRTTCYHCLVLTAAPLPISAYGVTHIALKICSGCQVARFCSRDCQVSAWQAYHKYECRTMEKVKSNLPPAIFRAVMRVVLLKDRNRLSSQEWDRISGLTSHAHILAARGRTSVADMAEGIKHLTLSSMESGMIQKLFFVMKFNAVELPTPVHGGIGVMLDPLVARINHSCAPNVSIHRPSYSMVAGWMSNTQLSEDGKQPFAQAVPLRNIENGEELLISYIAPTQGVGARKKKCMEDYLFECNCSLCLSDQNATTDLAEHQPSLSSRYEQWTASVIRHLSRLGRDGSAYEKAAAAMYKSDRFLDYPTLYTTGDFPEMAMVIVKEGLERQSLDEALVNLLRVHFLVNHERFIGRHNPTILYSGFLLLDLFDALLTMSPSSTVKDSEAKEPLRKLSARGLREESMLYWRSRVCTVLRKDIEEGPSRDLLDLMEQRERQMLHLPTKRSDVEQVELKATAEHEMKTLLGLKEARWKLVLQRSGC